MKPFIVAFDLFEKAYLVISISVIENSVIPSKVVARFSDEDMADDFVKFLNGEAK